MIYTPMHPPVLAPLPPLGSAPTLPLPPMPIDRLAIGVKRHALVRRKAHKRNLAPMKITSLSLIVITILATSCGMESSQKQRGVNYPKPSAETTAAVDRILGSSGQPGTSSAETTVTTSSPGGTSTTTTSSNVEPGTNGQPGSVIISNPGDTPPVVVTPDAPPPPAPDAPARRYGLYLCEGGGEPGNSSRVFIQFFDDKTRLFNYTLKLLGGSVTEQYIAEEVAVAAEPFLLSNSAAGNLLSSHVLHGLNADTRTRLGFSEQANVMFQFKVDSVTSDKFRLVISQYGDTESRSDSSLGLGIATCKWIGK